MSKENLKYSGIYRISSAIDGKCYIGSAVKFSARWTAHLSKLRLNKHKNRYMQFAWNKYGEENFKFEVLEICEKSKLIVREQFYIDFHQSSNSKFGYNLRKVAHSNLGLTGNYHTEQSKLKLSMARKGSQHTEKTRQKMSDVRKGKKASEEAKANMSKAQKNRNLSEETKARMDVLLRTVNSGRKQSTGQINDRVNKIRKLYKWPCPEGSKCKCEKCMNTRNEDLKIWRDSKKAA